MRHRAPGWPGRLRARLLVSAQVRISGLGGRAPWGRLGRAHRRGACGGLGGLVEAPRRPGDACGPGALASPAAAATRRTGRQLWGVGFCRLSSEGCLRAPRGTCEKPGCFGELEENRHFSRRLFPSLLLTASAALSWEACCEFSLTRSMEIEFFSLFFAHSGSRPGPQAALTRVLREPVAISK